MDPPVPIFKRTKSKPVQRSRQPSPDIIDVDNPQESPATLASKLKTKAKRTKPKSKLSFGGDEEEGDGEVFEVKKSKLSRNLSKNRPPASTGAALSESLDHATISPRPSGQPTYDKAYLNQLKASTPTARPKVAGTESHDVEMSIDPTDLTPDTEISILSESQINAAKQKRERLRTSTTTGEDDFISLTVSRRADEPRGPHPDSRLVREEDELGEAEEEFADFTSAQERIALGEKSKKVEAAKRLETMKDLINDAEEQDDETMEWEEAQLRRGGHTAADFADKPVKATYKAATIPPGSAIPTLAPAIARLTQSLSTLTTSHTKDTTAMLALAEEHVQVDAREAEMREMVVKAEGKRSWFAAFRDWVENVAVFMDEKFPLVERLEDVHLSLLKERHDMVSQRRRGDDMDDLATFLGEAPISSEQLLDDLGRAPDRRERHTARSTRRFRRRAMQRATDEDDGFSTDGSLCPSEATDYEHAMEKMDQDARGILADVLAEEFRNPSLGIAKWFGQWRSKYADNYTAAFGGLGLVGAWELWVRLEIIAWNPLEGTRSMDSFSWYTALFDYSRPNSTEDTEADLGPDGDLVSAMISTAVLPRICTMVESGAFDPYSANSVRKMVDLAGEVEVSVEADSLKYKVLLQTVCTVFRDAINETETLVALFSSLNNAPFDPEAVPARRRFLSRRAKLLKNLLRWRKHTDERYGVGELCTRLVSQCMMPIALSGWDVGGESSIRQVATFLPANLVPYAMKARLG